MCLAIPMQVKAIEGSEAVVTQGGTELRVRTDLLDAVKVSDYVLVHAGFALQVVDPEEARATLAMLREMAGDAPQEGEASG
ncbi:MAG TPA: HypC/HybG/HupF family hydrogenase formation chaperone [Armatimonadota bacterium]|nr:HypC/HybG/HupF family hydrogenase formation chaperone [Armatimonadota bacterium]HPT97289.1 HypC/HybG/HupF family hydrogenase formation chaperone [Armatimonadota bacterium]